MESCTKQNFSCSSGGQTKYESQLALPGRCFVVRLDNSEPVLMIPYRATAL